MVAFGCVSGVIVLFGVFRRKRQPLLQCLSNLALLLLTIGLAARFNVAVSVHGSDPYDYDMQHGMWHLLAAQFQFVLISTLVTSGPIPYEPFAMAMNLLVLIVFLIFERTNVVGSGWYALVFWGPALFLLGGLSSRCRIRARLLLNPLKIDIKRDPILVLPVDSCE